MLAFGAGLGSATGAAIGILVEMHGISPVIVMVGAMLGGTAAVVPAIVAGCLLEYLDYHGRLCRYRTLKALLAGGVGGALLGLIYLPLLIPAVPAGILSAWLTSLWSAPLPPFPGEHHLPLRRRWAWYFLTGLLLALAPLLALAFRALGPRGYES